MARTGAHRLATRIRISLSLAREETSWWRSTFVGEVFFPDGWMGERVRHIQRLVVACTADDNHDMIGMIDMMDTRIEERSNKSPSGASAEVRYLFTLCNGMYMY